MQDREHQIADRAQARQQQPEEDEIKPLPVSGATRAAVAADEALSETQQAAIRRGR